MSLDRGLRGRLTLSHLAIGWRIHITTVAAVLGLLLLAGLETWSSVNALERDRKAMLAHVVETAWSVVAEYGRQSEAGRITKDEAQTRAMDALRAVRYRGQEYVFVTDMTPRMLVQPFRLDLEGKDAGGMVDANGLRIFVAFADLVRAHGEGAIRYLWPRPGSDQPVEKLSYLKGYAPWGWVIGSGLYIDDLRAEEHYVIGQGMLIALGAGLVVSLLAWLAGLSIVRPLHAVTQATEYVIGGDLLTAVPGTLRADEVGVLARALDRFRAGQGRAAELEAALAQDAAARLRRQKAMEQHTEDFAASVSGGMGTMMTAAGSMRAAARVVAESAGQTVTAAQNGAEDTARSTESLSTVAAATEELAASVQEIARQVSEATRTSRLAVDNANAAEATIKGLSQAADEIGAIVSAISQIARQTNLLALNATIEAARAGDAGKGFAVVASEVKQLAGQTAAATSGIGKQITAIQDAVAAAVGSVQTVCASIGGFNQISASIAAAVEQQGAATQEISGQVQRVARQTEEATQRLAGVVSIAERNGAIGGDLLATADQVADASATLRGEIDLFLGAMTDESGERRRYERVDVGGALCMLSWGEGGRQQQVRLRDISLGGAGLSKLDVTPEIGLPITLTLPNAARPLTGRVARLIEDKAEPGVGVVFRQDAATLAELESFIARLAGPAGAKPNVKAA